MGPVGLIDKYNAPATLLSSSVEDGVISADVRERGRFAAVGPRAPSVVTVDGKDVPFTFNGGLITVQMPRAGETEEAHVRIKF